MKKRVIQLPNERVSAACHRLESGGIRLHSNAMAGWLRRRIKAALSDVLM
jgi:hypothetical protein